MEDPGLAACTYLTPSKFSAEIVAEAVRVTHVFAVGFDVTKPKIPDVDRELVPVYKPQVVTADVALC